MKRTFASIAAVVLLTVSVAGSQGPLSASDITTTLDRAASAYYEARFADTITLLAPLSVALNDRDDFLDERIRVKLQLALAYIGLNQLSDAESHFAEIYQIKSKFVLDPGQFPPKVLMLSEQAKCHVMCDRTDAALETGDVSGIVATLEETPSCSCMAPRANKAANVIYADAMENYKHGELAKALSGMRTALKFDPEHHLAGQYLDLIDDKLNFSIEVNRSNWRKQFESGNFAEASESYRQLVSANLEGRADRVLDNLRTEYRQVLTPIAEDWIRACAAHDDSAMDQLHTRVDQLLPDRSIAPDMLDQMDHCAPTPDQTSTPDPKSANIDDSCIESPSEIALIRLKSHDTPKLPAESRKKKVEVRANLKIDENGNARVQRLYGGSPVVNRAVVAAVRTWKFYPAMVDNRPRCVETEFSIALTH